MTHCRIELPHSPEMIEYPDILADGGDEVRLDEGDVAGVGDVQQRLEPHHEVGGESVVLLQSHHGLPAVRHELVILVHVCHHLVHLVHAVAHDPLLTVDYHIAGAAHQSLLG